MPRNQKLFHESILRKHRRKKHKAKLARIDKKKRRSYRIETKHKKFTRSILKVKVPSNFSLCNKAENVIRFISSIDNGLKKNLSIKTIRFECRGISKIDIGALSLWLSKINELGAKRINIQGDFPEDSNIKDIFVKSGFLDQMKIIGKRKTNERQNKNLMVCVGSSTTKNLAIGQEIKKAVKHLRGVDGTFKPLYSILQEICGNSIEHGNEKDRKKNWLMSTSYFDDYVLFSMMDIGEGILSTLRRKTSEWLFDKINFKKDDIDVLKGVFEGTYRSRTKELNRNKGLPMINRYSSFGYIEDLIVVTNGVLLDFCNSQNARQLKLNFKGTFYQLKLNKKCIEKWEKRKIKNVGF